MNIFTKQLNDPRSKFIIEFVDNIVNTLGIKEIDIELGNSVQIMHLGSIRQLNFCSEIKKEIEKEFKGEVKCRVIYYYSDGLPILLKNSRGIDYSYNKQSEYVRFGFTSKKIPVTFQKYPNENDIKLFLSNLRNRLFSNRDLANNLGKIYIEKKIYELNNLLDLDDECEEKSKMVDWYRIINNRLLNIMGIEIPNWQNVSKVFSKIDDPEILLDLVNKIRNKTKIIPIWKFDNNKRVRIKEKDIEFFYSEFSSKLFYPDVILRQCISSLDKAIIRIHGNKYDYQNLVDNFSCNLNPSMRIIYNANLKLGQCSNNFKPSIDFFNIILADKLEEVKQFFEAKNIFERNSKEWIIH